MSELHPTSPLLWALLLALPGLISGKQRGPCAAIFAEPLKPSASLEVLEGGIERGGGGLGGGGPTRSTTARSSRTPGSGRPWRLCARGSSARGPVGAVEWSEWRRISGHDNESGRWLNEPQALVLEQRKPPVGLVFSSGHSIACSLLSTSKFDP